MEFVLIVVCSVVAVYVFPHHTARWTGLIYDESTKTFGINKEAGQGGRAQECFNITRNTDMKDQERKRLERLEQERKHSDAQHTKNMNDAHDDFKHTQRLWDNAMAERKASERREEERSAYQRSEERRRWNR